MGNDVIVNKIETIERCLNRIIEKNLKDFKDYIYCINKLL